MDIEQKIDQEKEEVTLGQDAEEQAVPEAASAEPEEKKEKKAKKKSKASLELEKAQAEAEEYKNALIRERADFDNFRKRNKVAVSDAYANGTADAVLKIIPMIDNLERAAAIDCADAAYKAGVELVLKQCLTTLGEMHVEQIEAEGKPFDPNFHNAVMQVAPEEGEESGIVKIVLMKGYKMGDKVIRHAMVQVTE